MKENDAIDLLSPCLRFLEDSLFSVGLYSSRSQLCFLVNARCSWNKPTTQKVAKLLLAKNLERLWT
jgi:hypothetical protein